MPDLVAFPFVTLDALHVARYTDYGDDAFFFSEKFGVVWSFGHVEDPDDADAVVDVKILLAKGKEGARLTAATDHPLLGRCISMKELPYW